MLLKLPDNLIDLVWSFTFFKPYTKETSKAVDDWCENKDQQ